MEIVISSPRLRRSWFVRSIAEFQSTSDDQVLAELVRGSLFPVLQSQRDAWIAEVPLLRNALAAHRGMVYLEFAIPRMGRRVDAVVIINGIVLAIEFKMDAKEYSKSDIDQAYDYAIDLKYFHEASHNLSVVPILVASHAHDRSFKLTPHTRVSGLYQTICTNAEGLASNIDRVIRELPAECIDPATWQASRYCPTPTIVEAACALYAGHGVADISRNDAGAINLRDTSDQLVRIIEISKSLGQKAICFVTGVPGAGKTLVGLNIATKFNDTKSELHSVFLSGNGPLVAILREALARDAIQRERAQGKRHRKSDALAKVKAFIQNVHHFRDECLRDQFRPPIDHVALFDEAQRAWDLQQTASFMRRKKGVAGFNVSEPEFLISCMDRRKDWAVIVCLVGGGQEINTGEAGIGAWIEAVQRAFADWHLYISPTLTDSEYGAGKILEEINDRANVHYLPELHLGVSMRSFRAEKVSAFVKMVLDCEIIQARDVLQEMQDRYPIVLTRKLDIAKQWLREQASGNERIGIVVSSQAERLKPYAIDVRTPVNPVKWFLDGKDDVRSSYYLEDVATEFQVQGLELDWVCVSWDGDFRYNEQGWQHFSFRGTKWQRINKIARKNYLKNAYRVLLTRARQGMIIFIPDGSSTDPTRHPSYYDTTFAYLRSVGLRELK
jgi:hypothetical protein